ncbi:MAG: hypothetical protein GX229_10780, partial [Syntrophomonadaceae bacterium]|nr:hypothetical protein [Syntrophomonadaceae bacterium]
KSATEALTQVFYKVSSKLYEHANSQGGQGTGNADGGDVFDADFDVADDNK